MFVKLTLMGALTNCLLAGLLGSVQFGWATGVTNIPQNAIEGSLKLGSTQWSVVVAAFCVGGLIGAQIAGTFADKYGRKAFLVWHSLFFIAAGVLQVCARHSIPIPSFACPVISLPPALPKHLSTII